MADGNRPCKRKRTNPEEESSTDCWENAEFNPDVQRFKTGTRESEDGEFPQSCDCDKKRLNCNQNCSLPSTSFVQSRNNCYKCNTVKCNENPINLSGDTNQSCLKRNMNVTYLEGSRGCADVSLVTCRSRSLQGVPKDLSTDHKTLAKYSLEKPNSCVLQCTSKIPTDVEIGANSEQNHIETDFSSVLQCSSKQDTPGSCKTSKNLAELDTRGELQMSSDPKLPVDPLNPSLPFDPLMNVCSCSGSGNSPSHEDGTFQVCNPGFEVLCSPGKKISSQNSNTDPECGEETGETEDKDGEKKGKGQKTNALVSERSSVTDLISSRRATKFRIQKSLGESSENIRKFSWNSSGEKNESEHEACLSENDLDGKPNNTLNCENHNRTSYNAFRVRFTSDNLVNKESHSNLTSADHINKLPATILVNIFRQLRKYDLLCRASLVCKLWHQLVYDPDLWRNIDLRYQHKVTDEQFLTLTQISDRVTHIDISDTQNLTSEAVEVALKWCGHLRSLHMSRCYKVLDAVLHTLGAKCHRLRTLVMDGCYKITDDGLCKVAEGCRDLEKITLSRCSHHVTDKGVVAIAENCPRLREVILGYLSEVTDTSCVRLCELCPDLEIVTLMFSGVSEKGVRALKQLKKLKIIDISSLPGIVPADVATLTQFCPDLEAMNVSLNPEINDECLLQVVKYGRHLHLLQCVSCRITDHFLTEVGRHTKALRNLDIGWCQAVTDGGVRALSATCGSLQYLGLIRCDAVTAEAVEELMTEYPHITYSTFILESKKLIERARREGFMFREDQNHVDMLV